MGSSTRRLEDVIEGLFWGNGELKGTEWSRWMKKRGRGGFRRKERESERPAGEVR